MAGMGVVGLAVGTIFGLQAKAKEEDSKSHCWPDDATRCSPRGVAIIGQARTSATVANVGFALGGVLLAGGAVLYFAAPSSSSTDTAKPAPKLRALVLPQATGMSVEARF